MCVVARAVLEVTGPLIPADQVARLQDMVLRHLPIATSEKRVDTEEEKLVQAIKDEMKERHLTIQPEVTEKVSKSL